MAARETSRTRAAGTMPASAPPTVFGGNLPVPGTVPQRDRIRHLSISFTQVADNSRRIKA